MSLTYDDGLNSQLDNVVPALSRFDLKATFFLVEENVAARVKGSAGEGLARRL